jgi:glycerol-3-phosphate cytidylyltransferase
MRRVITYGTFDTFHYGHLEILRRAKLYGDFLIVGVSTDKFNELKGKKSNFAFEKRKEWVELISCVDLVIPENTWGQKEQDVTNYDVHTFVMGDDWAGEFDYLPCTVVYLARTSNISSTVIRAAT